MSRGNPPLSSAGARLAPRPDGYLPPPQWPAGSTATVAWANVESVCGRQVLEVLPGGRSVRCRGLSGEGEVVLKPMPRDCLVRPGAASDLLSTSTDRELHAHVRERLLRVREVADVHVANLCGVEEDAALGPMLIWQWVAGRDLSSLPADWESEPGGVGGLLKLARELTGAVERLHLLGIVHGRLHLRNVIVAPGNELVLTHVSPLVVDDPDRDSADLIRMLRELNARPRESWQGRGETAVLARVLAETVTTPPLGELREKLTRAGGTRYIIASAGVPERASRSLHWAIGLLAAAVLVALVVGWLTTRPNAPRLSLPESANPAARGTGGEGPVPPAGGRP